MYITSDLFGTSSDANHTHSDSSNLTPTPVSTSTSTSTCNAMADQHATLGKRKKRADLDPAEGPSSHTHPSFQRLSPTGRALHKRHAFGHTSPEHNPRTSLYTQGPTAYHTPGIRPLKQLRRTCLSPKRVPIIAKSTSHLMDTEPTTSSSCSSNTSSAVDLRPCHICYTAPKRRKDLENYQQCKRCEEHTCFICVRQCADGCGAKICRKCCVEVGEEGDTLCLDCYAKNVNS